MHALMVILGRHSALLVCVDEGVVLDVSGRFVRAQFGDRRRGVWVRIADTRNVPNIPAFAVSVKVVVA
jgi:hypothetical protein